jgi:hypothetical protein
MCPSYFGVGGITLAGPDEAHFTKKIRVPHPKTAAIIAYTRNEVTRKRNEIQN